jgi:hypothetical protein
MSDALYQVLEEVTDEQSFIRFAEALEHDRRSVEEREVTMDGFRGEWANQSISGFLEAATAWARSSAFGTRPGPKPDNPWRLFALFLWAGRSHE